MPVPPAVTRIALPGLLLLLPALASAQAPSSGPLNRTDGAQMATSMAYTLDACGDPALGATYRRAIADKVAHCPFTDTAKAQFRAATAAMDTQAKAEIARLTGNGKRVPDRVEGVPMSCADLMKDPETADLRSRMDRYARGQITVDQALPDSCEAGAAAGQ